MMFNASINSNHYATQTSFGNFIKSIYPADVAYSALCTSEKISEDTEVFYCPAASSDQDRIVSIVSQMFDINPNDPIHLMGENCSKKYPTPYSKNFCVSKNKAMHCGCASLSALPTAEIVSSSVTLGQTPEVELEYFDKIYNCQFRKDQEGKIFAQCHGSIGNRNVVEGGQWKEAVPYVSGAVACFFAYKAVKAAVKPLIKFHKGLFDPLFASARTLQEASLAKSPLGETLGKAPKKGRSIDKSSLEEALIKPPGRKAIEGKQIAIICMQPIKCAAQLIRDLRPAFLNTVAMGVFWGLAAVTFRFSGRHWHI